jgi:hypothetical protein
MTPIRATRRILCGLTIATFATQTLPAQRLKVILNDSRARVTLVTLAPGQSHAVQGARPHGSVWIPLDDGVALNLVGHLGSEEFIQGGRYLVETVGAGSAATLSLNDNVKLARIVVVDIKSATQPITLDPTTLEAFLEMQDGSARNDTLLIAESALRLQDVRYIGDEGYTFRGRPHIIRMEPGDVRWIRHGVHHIKNLRPTPVRFTLIEW